MSLIGLLVVLIVVGLLLWAVGQIPMDATIKRIITVVVIVFVCLWLLQALGLLGPMPDLRLR